jgi:hypothetical protein
MWKLYQLTIITAVMFFAIADRWYDLVGKQSYAPAIIATFAAWLGTKLLSAFLSWRARQ